MASGVSDTVEISDRRRHPFYTIDNDLIKVYGPRISVYGIAVYNVLACYANQQEESWPSYQTIASHLDMSRRKVIETIDSLIQVGLIAKENRTSDSGDPTSNLYCLVDLHPALGSASLHHLVHLLHHLVRQMH